MKNGQRLQFSDASYMCILIIWPSMEGDTILVLSNQTEVSRLAKEMISHRHGLTIPGLIHFFPLYLFLLHFFLPNHQGYLILM